VFSGVTIGAVPWDGTVQMKWRQSHTRISSKDYASCALRSGDAPISPSGVLMRTSDLVCSMAVDIPSPTITDFAEHGGGCDILTLLRVAKAYKFVARSPLPLVFFRSHDGNLTKTLGGGKGHARYLQARVQYAMEVGEERALKRLLAEAWIMQSWRRRAFLRLEETSRQFCDAQTSIPLSSFISSGARLVRQRARRIVARLVG
jgi:hypothetical protein